MHQTQLEPAIDKAKAAIDELKTMAHNHLQTGGKQEIYAHPLSGQAVHDIQAYYTYIIYKECLTAPIHATEIPHPQNTHLLDIQEQPVVKKHYLCKNYFTIYHEQTVETCNHCYLLRGIGNIL